MLLNLASMKDPYSLYQKEHSSFMQTPAAMNRRDDRRPGAAPRLPAHAIVGGGAPSAESVGAPSSPS
jgi:hypothetical protein